MKTKARKNETTRLCERLIDTGHTPFHFNDGGVGFIAPPETIRQLGWRVLQRNRGWVEGCKITESVRDAFENDGGQSYRRFTATIRGWENFKIWEGYIDRPCAEILAEVMAMVTAVRDRIDSGDESDFYQQPINRKQ